MYDIIVLGGGPGGYSSAIKAAKAGLKVALIEKENLGGVCLNWGCIPTKSLLKSSSVFYEVTKGSLQGIISAELTADINVMVQRSRQISSDMAKGIAFLVKKHGIDLYYGSGEIISKGTISIKGITGENSTTGEDCTIIGGKNIIIATGAGPRHFDTIPVDGKNIIDSKGALQIDHIPESIIIVGSGAIGAEFATFFSQIGSKVTLVEYAERITPLEDTEISSAIERSMRKAGIKTLVGTSVRKAEVKDGKCHVLIESRKGEEIIESEMVLSAVGISANIEDIGLENIAVKCEKGRIAVDNHFRTNVEGIYAIGDVIPTTALAHVAVKEGEIAVADILGEEITPIDYSNIPSCIFTHPEIASVGLTETQVKKKCVEYIVGRFSYMASGKAASSGMKDGLVKLIFEADNHRLIGAHLCGNDVAEMIGECALAIANGNTAEQLSSLVHAHPTMHEAIMEAARNAID